MSKQTSSRMKTTTGDSADQVGTELCRRVKELRTARGWSLEALAAASGVSRSMLSQIERNQANPTLGVATRIAQAFGLELGELVQSPDARPKIHVIRADDREYHYRTDATCRIRTLSPLHLEKDIELYEVELKARGALKSAPHFTGTREFLTVQQGRLQVTSADDSVRLGKGDSASYRADVSHCIENIGRTAAVALLVVIYE